MKKQKAFIAIVSGLVILLLVSIFLIYRSNLEKHHTIFRCAQSSLNTSLMTIRDIKGLSNEKLVANQMLSLEASLISVIGYYKEMPELLSHTDRIQLIKSIDEIERLVAEGKLDFLSRADLADETKAFIKEGIAAIQSDQP